MNIFNQKAAEDGREFARTNPNATGVDIDNAAPKFNPARRHFQMAAYDLLNRQNTEIFYRWAVRCRSGHSSGGMASTVRDAYEYIRDVKELYMEQGREVVSISIYDRNEVAIVAIDTL